MRNIEHFRNHGFTRIRCSWLESKPVLELNKRVKNYDLNYTSDSEFEDDNPPMRATSE